MSGQENKLNNEKIETEHSVLSEGRYPFHKLLQNATKCCIHIYLSLIHLPDNRMIIWRSVYYYILNLISWRHWSFWQLYKILWLYYLSWFLCLLLLGDCCLFVLLGDEINIALLGGEINIVLFGDETDTVLFGDEINIKTKEFYFKPKYI